MSHKTPLTLAERLLLELENTLREDSGLTVAQVTIITAGARQTLAAEALTASTDIRWLSYHILRGAESSLNNPLLELTSPAETITLLELLLAGSAKSLRGRSQETVPKATALEALAAASVAFLDEAGLPPAQIPAATNLIMTTLNSHLISTGLLPAELPGVLEGLTINAVGSLDEAGVANADLAAAAAALVNGMVLGLSKTGMTETALADAVDNIVKGAISGLRRTPATHADEAGIKAAVLSGAQAGLTQTGFAASEFSELGTRITLTADTAVSELQNAAKTAALSVSATVGAVTETGGSATFTVKLEAQPSAEVTITLFSSDPGEGTIAPGSLLTFTPDNWNAPQTVTVSGVADGEKDGDQPFSILLGAAVSRDQAYNGLDPDNVPLLALDQESAGFLVSSISGDVAETGTSATFTVTLRTPPAAEVAVSLVSGDPSEGTVTPGDLLFTAATWNIPQTVTVTGVDDAEKDGDQRLVIVPQTAVSNDSGYDGLKPDNVLVTNLDNDSPGVLIRPLSGKTTEAGETATFTLQLKTPPASDVTMPLSSHDTTEGTTATASVTFTSKNWNIPQTITVTGVDDDRKDGNQLYAIITSPITSNDAAYKDTNPENVILTNMDNE